MGSRLGNGMIAAALAGLLGVAAGCGAAPAAQNQATSGGKAASAAPSSASSGAGPFCGGGGATACPTADIGGGGGSEPVASVHDGFTEVSLVHYFNADAVVASGTAPRIHAPNPPKGHKGAGLFGAAFLESTFPRPGNWSVTLDDSGHSAVTFLIPSQGVGVASVDLLTAQETIPVPAGQYSMLWLLEADFGGYAGFPILLNYKTGSGGTVNAAFSGWCRGVDDPPEYLAYLGTEHVGATGQTLKGRCGLFAEGIAVDSSNTLVSVTLPATSAELTANDAGTVGIVAMSLQA